MARVVVHTPDAKDLTLGPDYIIYDDPTDSYDRHNFHIYTALLFPEGDVKTRFVADRVHQKQGIYGNAVGVKRGVRSGERFNYWFGASWCQSGTPDHDFWVMQVKRFLQNAKQPIKTDITGVWTTTPPAMGMVLEKPSYHTVMRLK